MNTGTLMIVSIMVCLFLGTAILWEVIYQLIGKGKQAKVILKDNKTGKELKELESEEGISLLSLMQEKGIDYPAACGGKANCGLCKIKVGKEFGPATVTEKSFFSSHNPDDEIFDRLACQCKVTSGAVMVNESDLMAKTYNAKVVKTEKLTADKMEIWFQIPEKEGKIEYKAGQFIQIKVNPEFTEWYYWFFGKQIKKVVESIGKKYQENDPNTARWVPYSVASKPTDGNLVKLIVRLVPSDPKQLPNIDCLGPSFVHNTLKNLGLKAGSKVKLKGPFGHFFLKPEPHEAIGIAGGAGMAPLVSILETWFIDEARKERFVFFIGERRFQDLAPEYLQRWMDWTEKYPNFVFVPVLSGAFRGDDPKEFNDGDKEAWDKLPYKTQCMLAIKGLVNPAGTQWLGHTGFIPPVMKKYVEWRPNQKVYECGPPPMVLTCNNELISLCGITKENMLFDDFFNISTPPTMEQASALLFKKQEVIAELKKHCSRNNETEKTIAGDYIKRLDGIIIFGMIFPGKFEEANILLDKVKNIIQDRLELICIFDSLNNLFKQYEPKKK